MGHQYGETRMAGTPLSIMFSAGPYTPDADLLFKPWHRLMDEAERARPDVLLLVSASSSLALAQAELALTSLFFSTARSLPLCLASRTRSARSRSAASRHLQAAHLGAPDAHGASSATNHHHSGAVYARRCECACCVATADAGQEGHGAGHSQGEWWAAICKLSRAEADTLHSPSTQRVKCLPNPCLFNVNEVVFGVTTGDVLRDLGKEETCVDVRAPYETLTAKHKDTDNLGRLCRHVLGQRR